MVVSKPDNTKRITVDYRKLNQLTEIDAYPLPRVDDSSDALSGFSSFSIFYLRSGFHQVKLSPEAKDMVAFVTRSGHWTWRAMAHLRRLNG